MSAPAKPKHYTFSLGTGHYTMTGHALTLTVKRAIHYIFTLGTGHYAVSGKALTFSLKRNKGPSPMALGVSYITTFTSSASSNSYNFGNFTSGSDGIVVVLISAFNATSQLSPNSVTIGGVSCTLYEQNNLTDSVAIAVLNKVAGTYNLTVGFSGTISGSQSVVASVYNITGGAAVVPFAHGRANSASTSSLSINYAANGAAVFMTTNANSTGVSWNQGATRDYAAATTQIRSAAHLLTASAATPGTETTTGDAAGGHIFGASFQVGTIAYTFTMDAGSYAYTGKTMPFSRNGVFSLGTGTYVLTGNALSFVRARIFNLATGVYTYTGSTLFKIYKWALAPGAYAITGKSLGFLVPLRNLASGTATSLFPVLYKVRAVAASLFSLRGVGSTVVPKRSPPPTPKD